MNTKISKSENKKIGATVFAIAMVFGIGIGTMGTAMADTTTTGEIQAEIVALSVTCPGQDFGSWVANSNYNYITDAGANDNVTAGTAATGITALGTTTTYAETAYTINASTASTATNSTLPEGVELIIDDDNIPGESSETSGTPLVITGGTSDALPDTDPTTICSGLTADQEVYLFIYDRHL